MARGRLISRTLGSSRKFHQLLQEGGKLGEFCQVLFPLIVANTDDFGRMPGDAFTIKNVVLPSSRRPERDFDRALDVMVSVGLIQRYPVQEAICLQVNQFEEHQPNLHKRTQSKFPEPPGDSGTSGKVRLNLTESNLTEVNPTQPPSAPRRTADALFEQFWAAYPKKKAKDSARKAWDKRRPTEAFLAAMLAALETQKRTLDWRKENGRYIPFPASWLNQARWTDEADVVVSDLRPDLGVWECPHEPKCQDGRWRCHQRTEMERIRAEAS